MRIPPFTSHTVALLAAGLLFGTSLPASATVTILFDDSGPGITATATGSLDLGNYTTILTDVVESPATGGDSTSFFTVSSPGLVDVYTGVNTESTLDAPPILTPSITFGFSGGNLFIEAAVPENSVYTLPGGVIWSWTFQDTLAEIGLDTLTPNVPFTVFNYPGAGDTEDAIQFLVIPEPSSFLLTPVGLALWGMRRRILRKRA